MHYKSNLYANLSKKGKNEQKGKSWPSRIGLKPIFFEAQGMRSPGNLTDFQKSTGWEKFVLAKSQWLRSYEQIIF